MKSTKLHWCVFLFLSPLLVAQDPIISPPPYADLLEIVNTRLEEIEGPEARFKEEYLNRLKKLQTATQQTGNLEHTLLVQEEIKSFQDSDKERDYAVVPELLKLRGIYDAQILKLHETEVKSRQTLYGSYFEKLEERKKRYTQSGNLDGAQLIAIEQDRVSELMNAELEAWKKLGGRGSALGEEEEEIKGLWEWKTMEDLFISGGPVIQQKPDGAWRIEKGNGTNTMILTKTPLTPPFVVSLELTPETDSNVRFCHQGGFLVQMNIGGEGGDMVISAPNRPSITVKGKGKLDEGKAHNIEFRIEEDRIEVRVDRRVRAREYIEFTGFNARVGFSAFRECPITIRNFKAYPMTKD